jgi:hypothetical protein
MIVIINVIINVNIRTALHSFMLVRRSIAIFITYIFVYVVT